MSWFKDKEPHHLVIAFICFLVSVIILMTVINTNAHGDELNDGVKYGYSIQSTEYN